jgi:integrase
VIDGLEEQKRYIAGIRRRAGSAWEGNDLLFPNKHGGYLDRWVISQQFQRVLEKAGLPYMRLHDLRHSAATLLLAAGVNVKVVQEMLGHSDIRITLQMYSHVMPDMQKDAADKMNDMFQ